MTDFTQSTGSGGQLKLSLTEVSVNVVGNQSTVHVVYQIYTPPGSFHLNNDIAVSLSGDVTWSSNWSFNSSGGWHTLYDSNVTYTHDSSGVKAIAVTASMGATGTSGVGGPSSVSSGTFNLSNIVQAPAAPGTPTATRINDGQIDLSWTNNSASHHEYANQNVQRSVDGGGYATIASSIGAGATSYSDTTASANHKYTYKIFAQNGAGNATSAASAVVYTTPGAPTIGTATKQSNSDIVLSWTNNVGYGDTTYGTDIYESQNGGTFNYLASVAGGLATWTHVAPDTSKTHAYKVLATKGALSSSLSSASNTVTLLATAGAPTGLSPSGVARDAAGAITLSWTHNPTDGTPQSKRHVQAKVNAGSYADLVNDSSTTSNYTVAGGTWSNGDTITWKVATAGENGTLGAYSAESTITLSARPTATINVPTSTYSTSSLTVEWGYFQAQSSAQATWQASLYDNAAALIETISGTTEVEGTFTHALADATSYTVTVTVMSAAGLASTVASQAFTVAYLPPAAIAVAGVFDNAAGFTVLTLTGAAPVTDVTEAIVTVDVQRQIAGGAWVTILTGIVLDAVSLTATVQDTLPITVGTNTYRAIAYSALPSSVTSATDDVVTAETTWGYLSGGGSFATVARVRAMSTFTPTAGRAKALYHFAGRPKPVQLMGEALSFTLAVSGKLTSDSGTAADFEALGQADGVACWRGPDGRRVFGSISPVSTPRSRLAIGGNVSFTLTELDFTEGDQ